MLGGGRCVIRRLREMIKGKERGREGGRERGTRKKGRKGREGRKW